MRVSQCCCGCSLKTGTILIGVFYLVIYFIITVILGVLPALIGRETEETEKESNDVVKVVFGIVIGLFILMCILEILLIVGAVKEKPGLIKTWFVIHLTFMVLGAIGFISKIIFQGYYIPPSEIIITILEFLLSMYFMVVVFSYHEELKDRQLQVHSGQRAVFVESPEYKLPNEQPAGEGYVKVFAQ